MPRSAGAFFVPLALRCTGWCLLPAACEGFFGRLKTEMFFSRDWLSTTIEEFVAAVDAYIRWYNYAWIKISLGLRSATEHRRNLGIAA